MLRIVRYGNSRFWALYDGPDLVVVTVYKRGAREVQRRLAAQPRATAEAAAEAGIEALTISAEKLPSMLEETREKVEELQTYGAEEVYDVVKKNLDRMKDLKDLVNPNISMNPNERAKKITALLKQMRDDS